MRSLLQGWYDWQRARSAARVQTDQTALAQEQLDVATRRVKAGDVPRLDELMAQAERDRMQAQQQQALGQEAVLQAELQQAFSGPEPGRSGAGRRRRTGSRAAAGRAGAMGAAHPR